MCDSSDDDMQAEDASLLHHPAEEHRGVLFTMRLAFFATTSYLCLYGLRKPWVVLIYTDVPPILGVSAKIGIAAAQMVSYFCGKTFGVGLVSRVPQAKLHRTLALAGGAAALGWLGFAMLPIGIFTLLSAAITGFPLALTWCLIYRYVEGRRCSDAVGGVLGCSIVVGPGLAKLVCAALLRQCASLGLTEWHAPLLTACVAYPLLLLCLWGLTRTPPPTPSEIAELGDRAVVVGGASGGQGPISRLLGEHWMGIVAVGTYNALYTGAREVRDIFQPELWLVLYSRPPDARTFLATELPATVLLLLVLPAVSTVRSAPRALVMMHGLMLISALTMPLLGGVRALGGGAVWFSLLGAAIFLGTVTVTAGFSDRLVSALRLSGSSATLIQILDACGYAGSLATLAAVETFSPAPGQMLATAETLFAWVGPAAAVCALLSAAYWSQAIRNRAGAAGAWHASKEHG